jgi:hypothetical protein
MDLFLALFTAKTISMVEKVTFQLWCETAKEKIKTPITGRLANHSHKKPVLNTTQKSHGSYSLTKNGRGHIDLHQIINDLRLFLASNGYITVRLITHSCIIRINDVAYCFTKKTTVNEAGTKQSSLILWKIGEKKIGVMKQDQVDYLLGGPLQFCAPSHCERQWVSIDVCH